MAKKKTVVKKKTLGQELSKIKTITNISKNGYNIEWKLSEDKTELFLESIQPRGLKLFNRVLFVVLVCVLIVKWVL